MGLRSMTLSAAAQRHVDDTVRVWLGLRRAHDVPALPEPLARLLLRFEEYERTTRDRWGCWDHTFSESGHRIELPEIDRWVAARRAELGRNSDLVPLWPDRRPFAICLTHDVDIVSGKLTPKQVARTARAAFAPDGRRSPLRVARPAVRAARALRTGIVRAPSLTATVERSVAMEAKRDLTASYFFTVPPAGSWTRWDCVYAPEDRCTFRGEEQRIGDVMRTLRMEGFDVGLHGSYESARTPGVLERERARLETAVGAPVETTRQHFLHWDVRWTQRLQEQAGLRADSSLGFNRTVGFRAGTSLPFRQFDVAADRALDVVEVPLVVQDAALLGPIAVRPRKHDVGEAVDRVLGEVAAASGLLTCVFHPDKLAHPDWLSLYEWTLDRAVESGAWVTSVAGIDAWWRERERELLT
jgi:hypothetical protein